MKLHTGGSFFCLIGLVDTRAVNTVNTESVEIVELKRQNYLS